MGGWGERTVKRRKEKKRGVEETFVSVQLLVFQSALQILATCLVALLPLPEPGVMHRLGDTNAFVSVSTLV